VDVTKLLVPLMVALIESSPSLVALLGKEWALLKNAAREGRELSPTDLVLLSKNALLSSEALRLLVEHRTGPQGDWK